MNLKTYWNGRTIYRKIVLIALAVNFLGCFIFSVASMYSFSSSLNKMADRYGIGSLPERMTIFSLGKFMLDMGSEDGFFYLSIIAMYAILLAVQILGKKRGSYIATLLVMSPISLFTGIGISAAGSVPGYESKPFMMLLIYLIIAVIYVVSVLGAVLELKAQAKLAAKYANGYVPSGSSRQIDPEKMEKFKEQAGNFVDTSVAVAKKGAKMAVKGFFQAADAVKDFVETAKNESKGETSQKSAAVPKAQTPDVQPVPAAPKTGSVSKVIPQTGSVTGVRGMFAGAQIPLAAGEKIVIGRSEDCCHIILEGDAISRVHCTIQYDGKTGNYLVIDSSANGTFKSNGSKVAANQVVAMTPGSVIWIGSNENTFQLG